MAGLACVQTLPGNKSLSPWRAGLDHPSNPPALKPFNHDEQLCQICVHGRSGRDANLRSSVPQKCTPARWPKGSITECTSGKMHL